MIVNTAAILVITAWAIFVIIRLTMFPPRNKHNSPGPHNNWRREKSGDDSSFYESGEGITGGSEGGVH